jgi:amino acid transporter
MTGPTASPPTLRRELGKWDLTAIGVNQVIGSAIFILPSQVVAQIGNWSPFAFLAIGIGIAARGALLC